MEVTNISPDTVHRFVPPWDSSRRYVWQPGETLEVPEDVAEEVTFYHPQKMVKGRGTVFTVEETHEAEAATYEDRQMTPRRGRRR